jgi:hypothetical protein
MTHHEAWGSGTTPPVGDLRMDEPTARQLADELTTLASSMFGLLQPHPSANPAPAAAAPTFGTAFSETPPSPAPDPASVVSVAIPVEPVVAVAVPPSWAPPEPDAQATALAVPALAVPEMPDGLGTLGRHEPGPGAPAAVELPTSPPALALVPAIEVPGLDEVDRRGETEAEPVPAIGPIPVEPPAPAPRQSMALLNEIAFLDD